MDGLYGPWHDLCREAFDQPAAHRGGRPPPAGFTVLHRSEDGAAYLIAYTWVWDNVLHVRGATAAQPELGCPDDNLAHFMVLDRPWVGCVYELVPLGHERDAWVWHMLAPSIPDLDGYLADSMVMGQAR